MLEAKFWKSNPRKRGKNARSIKINPKVKNRILSFTFIPNKKNGKNINGNNLLAIESTNKSVPIANLFLINKK